MWKFYIELFKEDCYGNYVENADISDGLSICCDLSVAKFFYKEMTWKKEDCLARKKQRSSSHTLLDSSPNLKLRTKNETEKSRSRNSRRNMLVKDANI